MKTKTNEVKAGLNTMCCPKCGEWAAGPIGSTEGSKIAWVCFNDHPWETKAGE